MTTTADPRANPPAAASHHIKPWAPPPRAHRMPSLPAVSGGEARDRRRSSSSHRRGGDDAVVEEPCDGRLEDLRAKLMGHLCNAPDRLRLPQPKRQPRSPEPEPKPEPPAAPLRQPPPPQQQDAAPAATSARPWNLRDRKRRPTARGSAALVASPATSPWEPAAEKARGGERAPFAVALTAEEVEEDVYALTGARPRRRPRKRPRVVQRQLDSLFPGLWLTEITADAYKVPDE